MKGSQYNDSVLVSQDQLRRTDQDKSSSIKERFNALISHGIIEDGSNPLTLTYSGGATINISGGEAYCDFDKTNTSPEYGNTGERIYVPSSLTSLDIKGGVIAGGDPRHFFAVYVEIHKNRKLDEVNVAHYTEKDDSYIVAQLTDADLTTLNSAGSIYVSDNYVHSIQTDLTSLSDEELNDTFGSSRWDRTGDFLVDVTMTEFNSVYLGTADDAPSVSTEYGTRVRPVMFINEDVLNLPDIEDLSQENHRKKQHSNGISGSIAAFQATVDGTTVPDELNITDLTNNEFGYIGGHRVSTGDIASGYLSSIQATNNSYFPDGGYDYYVYVIYDSSTGTFKTTAFKVADVPAALVSNGEENYLLIGKVYIDAGRNTIEAYNGDNRYSAASSTNPITDLRKFGTIDSINISDDGFSSIAGDNLISNGDFEGGITNDIPTEWSGNGGILDNVNLLGGKHSLLLEQNEIVISNPIPYNQLATYNLRVAAKAAGTNGTYTVGVRGYVGKDWADVELSDDATAPTNIAYLSTITTEAKTTAWVDSGPGIFTSADWSWTTPTGGAYTSGDLDLIKYIRIFIRANNDGSSDLYIDNVKLFDNNNVAATSTEINQALDGISANVTDTNLNALTGGSDTALHTHTLANGATNVSATATEVNRIADGITATAAEANQALDGISANVTDTNLNTLTAGAASDADSLHTHPDIEAGNVTNGDSHDHNGGDGNQIPQGGLKTSTGEVSGDGVNLTLPGGEYGFYPQGKVLTGNLDLQIAKLSTHTSYLTTVWIEAGASTGYVQQRYITASPPYIVGNQTWGHFLYLLVETATGNVKASYEAPDPPYAYNGPEHNLKDSPDRIAEVPHPFADYYDKDPSVDGLEITLVDLRATDVTKWKSDNAQQGKGILEDLANNVNPGGQVIPPQALGLGNIPGFTDKVKIRKKN